MLHLYGKLELRTYTLRLNYFNSLVPMDSSGKKQYHEISGVSSLVKTLKHSGYYMYHVFNIKNELCSQGVFDLSVCYGSQRRQRLLP
jgi:hypothetical protein